MYWAVNRDVEGVLRIMYLFGYHTDYGNNFALYCQSDPLNLCGGHFGDSEFVQVAVEYDTGTEHWMLTEMFTAAHYGTGGESSATTSHSNLRYPASSRDRWFPRVFVARDKHGSFANRRACNAGAFDSDDCADNVDDVRFDVDYYRNVGSSSSSMVSEPVSSIDNTLVYGGEEYFWTAHAFCGWDTASMTSRLNCATAYGDILSAFGY